MAENIDPHDLNNNEPNLPINAEEQAVLDEIAGITKEPEDTGDVELPSDKPQDEGDKGEETKLLAGKYKNVDELKKGIVNIGSELDQEILDGMSDDALEKYYSKLYKDFSSKGRQERKPKEEEATKDNGKTLREQLNEDTENGKYEPSDEILTKFKEAGFSKDDVETFLDAETLKVQQVEASVANEALAIVGSQEQLDAVTQWAKANVDENIISHLATMNDVDRQNAMYGIKARYDAANPTDAKKDVVRIDGTAQRLTSDSYANQAQYIADVSDPRYGKNVAYTTKVEDKFANSTSLH